MKEKNLLIKVCRFNEVKAHKFAVDPAVIAKVLYYDDGGQRKLFRKPYD